MLGPPKLRRLDEPIVVSLEDLIPADHFYRHLETKLDLGFVRERVRASHATEAHQKAMRKRKVWVEPPQKPPFVRQPCCPNWGALTTSGPTVPVRSRDEAQRGGGLAASRQDGEPSA
jgi:hypothetical protein